MNSKMKTILAIAGFILFIGAASFAYSSLKDKAPSSVELNPAKEPADETGTAAESRVSESDSGEADKPAGESGTAESTEEEQLVAPDFTAVDAEGNEVKLSDYLGKPIVLNFWASWCPPCKSEMPEFNKVYEEMGDEVQFLMVDMVDGQRETKEKGEKYVADQGFTFPVLYDTKGEASYFYGVMSLPTTYFIDKDGYVITGAQGAIDEESLRKGIGYITEQ